MTDDGHVPDEKLPYTKLVTKVKRGTGTRDQDTTKVVTRHPDPVKAATNHRSSIEAFRAAADAARSIQPGEEDDDEA
jgi:hypothetical protein